MSCGDQFADLGDCCVINQSRARPTAQAAAAEPSAVIKKAARQPATLRTPPNASSVRPITSGLRNPVVKPVSA